MSFDPRRRVRISRHASLKTRPQGDVLVLPERALRIGGSGAEILRLCEAGSTGESIVAALRARHPEVPGIEEVVFSFLDEMLTLGGVVIDEDRGAAERPS